jgi:hypothetical protein
LRMASTLASRLFVLDSIVRDDGVDSFKDRRRSFKENGEKRLRPFLDVGIQKQASSGQNLCRIFLSMQRP